jgi:glycosyltransferase involved in cell wall biosynthesis
MNFPLISIVVAIYNIDAFLDRCLDSLVKQTYRNIEILLIDDKSTDMSSYICDHWADVDSRIKVIHKSKNEGLGMARNTGICNASGDFIFFIDGDDYVSHELVSTCLDEEQKNKTEIVQYGFWSCIENGKIPYIPKRKIYKGKNEIEKYISDITYFDKKKCLNSSAWSKMFSSSFIKKSNFSYVSEREYISEDIFSNFQLLKDLTSVSVINKPLYFYCYNGNSLSRKYDANRFERNNNQILRTMDYLTNVLNSKKALNSAFFAYFENIFPIIKNIVLQNSTKNAKILIYKLLKNPVFLIVVKKAKFKICSFKIDLFIFCLKFRLYRLVSLIFIYYYKY